MHILYSLLLLPVFGATLTFGHVLQQNCNQGQGYILIFKLCRENQDPASVTRGNLSTYMQILCISTVSWSTYIVVLNLAAVGFSNAWLLKSKKLELLSGNHSSRQYRALLNTRCVSETNSWLKSDGRCKGWTATGLGSQPSPDAGAQEETITPFQIKIALIFSEWMT